MSRAKSRRSSKNRQKKIYDRYFRNTVSRTGKWRGKKVVGGQLTEEQKHSLCKKKSTKK